MRAILLLASLVLAGIGAAVPTASASECALYVGDWRDPSLGVNIPLIRGGYGPCSSTCPGVVSIDLLGASGCILPQLGAFEDLRG